MALLFSLLWKVLYYGVTIGLFIKLLFSLPSIQSPRISLCTKSRQNVGYLFLNYGTIIDVTIHCIISRSLPVIDLFNFSLDLVCDCLFCFFKLLFAGWLYHEDYRVQSKYNLGSFTFRTIRNSLHKSRLHCSSTCSWKVISFIKIDLQDQSEYLIEKHLKAVK